MNDTTKYLIHAAVTADGVVERSDVVGAIFGQTEGLLGDELDLRDLQESSKVGRIDVEVESKSGTSIGEVTIATSLDKVETATLAASLETITRIGPCRSKVEVTNIEDVRAAKRRNVVERATELLMTSFEDTVMSSEEILAKVREKVRVEEVTEYEGLPAGPNVGSSDAMVVVEGRADVLQLLRYGIKNAIGVEGTNVPETVAELSKNRTVTTFLDGDRGGDLILEELAQVGQVDYVAVAPEDRAVEDLSHHEVFTALREKVPYETVAAADESARAIAESDPSGAPVADGSTTPTTGIEPESPKPVPSTNEPPAAEGMAPDDSVIEDNVPEGTSDGETEDAGVADTVANEAETGATASTLEGHVNQVVDDESDQARLVDEDFGVLDEIPAAGVFEAIRDAEVAPTTVVLDDKLTQRVLDVAAQRGVDRVIAREKGEFTKRPTGVRVLTAAQLEPA